jgi:hypothetical protein
LLDAVEQRAKPVLGFKRSDFLHDDLLGQTDD